MNTLSRLLRQSLIGGVGLALALPMVLGECHAQVTKTITPSAEKLGWHVSGWHYPFQDSGLYEGLNAMSSIGICYFEGMDDKDLTSKRPGVKNNYRLSQADRREAKRRMDSLGVYMRAYYVRTVHTGDIGCFRQVFDFMKEMGVTTMSCDPPDAQVRGKLDSLCIEYTIGMAIHNHSKPTLCWHPDSLAHYIMKQSNAVGGCSDVGNWLKSGLDPLKSLRSFHDKRVCYEIHLHDMLDAGGWYVDTTVGKGTVGANNILEQLYQWKWQGNLSIEIEGKSNYKLLVREFAQSAQFIERFAAAKLASAVSVPPRSDRSRVKRSSLLLAIGDGSRAAGGSREAGSGGAVYNISGKMTSRSPSSGTESKQSQGFYIFR